MFILKYSKSVFVYLYIIYNLILYKLYIIKYTVWAAKVPSVPVQMAVTSFGNQKGLIVTMDDCGNLAISYLGKIIIMYCVIINICFGWRLL